VPRSLRQHERRAALLAPPDGQRHVEHAPQDGVVEDLAGRADRREPAIVQSEETIGVESREVGVVQHDQDAEPHLGEAALSYRER